MTVRIEVGDCIEVMRRLPDCLQVHTCVTSPPYFGLRDYGHAGQIGLEPTPDEYVAKLVEVFREVRRVLRDDGTVWLNLGDSYSSGGRTTQTVQTVRRPQVVDNKRKGPTSRDLGGDAASGKQEYLNGTAMRPPVVDGLGSKQLLGIPWRVAFALQADGWYLRSDIIWHKPNPMPESVTDRPTKAHEYLFLLSKSPRYYYDAAAIAEKSEGRELFGNSRSKGHCEQRQDNDRQDMTPTETRNRRSVWTIATSPYSGAHFATFPPDLIEPCIKAGCPEGGTVLDPFGGAGTTGLVADRLQRNALLIELNPEYAEMAKHRITGDAPLFAEVV
jgi:DNA modification methylase